MDKKFRVEDATTDDQKAFSEGLNKLLTELSLTFILVVNKLPLNVKNADGTSKNVFVDEPMLLLQKKIEVSDTSEPEAPKITDVKFECNK